MKKRFEIDDKIGDRGIMKEVFGEDFSNIYEAMYHESPDDNEYYYDEDNEQPPLGVAVSIILKI